MAPKTDDPNELWYSDIVGCWMFRFEGKRYRAPKSIGPNRRKSAEEWRSATIKEIVKPLKPYDPDKGGRPSSVWWWDSRKRWAFSAGRKRHIAPASIREHDHRGAERWHREMMAELYPDRPVAGERPEGGRVRCEFKLKASTLKRLRRMAIARRRATGKPTSPGRVIDDLVRDASRPAAKSGNPGAAESHHDTKPV